MSRTYSIANAKAAAKNTGALVDRGANGGLAGSDCRIIAKSPDRFVNIEGIDRHQITNIPIVTCGAYTVSCNNGPVIVVFHQFAGMMRGPTILSSGQLEAHMNNVNDRSRRIDAQGQLITTNDGFKFPLHVRNGLPYLDLRPFTDLEWDSLPHVVMTSDVDWDPSTLDGEFPLNGDEEFFDASAYDNDTNFDARGDYRLGTIVASARLVHDDAALLATTVLPDTMLVVQDFDHSPFPDDHDADGKHGGSTNEFHQDPPPPAQPPPRDSDDIVDTNSEPTTVFKSISPHVAKNEPDPNALRHFFAFLPADIVEKTLKRTTQYARVPMHDTLRRYYRSPYPALNVPRRNEDLLTDIVYSDTPAVDDGATSAAIYSGKTSHVMDVYGMKTDKQFVNTLEDIIRDRGAPSRLLSDHAITIRSSRVLDILRSLYIGQWTSEPHRQHQNTMERRYQTAKRLTNVAMDRSGCPASCWLLCLQYVCLVLNCTACRSLDWSIPLTVLLGVTVDVSPLLRFHWYQPVFYTVDGPSFPSESKEALGYFVGIATHCGHVMTFKILTDDNTRVLLRSQVRPADDPKRPNLRLTDLFDGEPPSKLFVRSRNDPPRDEDLPNLDSNSGEIEQDVAPQMVHVDTSELIGKTFLLDPQEDGTRHRARIVEMLDDHQYSNANSKEHVRFRLSVNDAKYEEIMSYGELLAHINKDEEQEVLWRYKRILGHQGPLAPDDPSYNGSTYNVQLEWENGEITYEPLNVIAADDPVTCATYALEHGLLDTPGWKRFKRLASRQKKLLRMANQSKLRSYRTAPRFKYGFEIPRDFDHALILDRRNGNSKWRDANSLEFGQLDDYQTFQDIGHSSTVTPPTGYKKIRVHLVFDVKHDGRHKVRCVADGHLTDVPVDSVYSGVVSLRGLRMMLFLAELNQLDVWATDVGNAYLEAETKEKIYIIAGSEFGDRRGHILIIKKALYGLRSSGKRWHERFADCLRDEGFLPCKAEPDIWIRPSSDMSCYEMVAVYVDDLAIGMKDPSSFLKVLTEKYKFKLKGSGPITFHLGCDFERDENGTLCMSPRQYIERMVSQYERMFASKPRTNVTSPLEKNDHPETDDSELLDAEGIQKYQSLVGSLQWAVSLGRIDVTTAVMTLSSFRAIPRQGHLDRAKRVVAYLYRFKFAKIRFRTHEPDFSDLPIPEYDWTGTVYGNVKEDIPSDTPKPLGKPVVTVSYVDANLQHCLITGRSVTGILHFLNGTPIDWYSKKMATVETATYGAEFVSARTCIEQLVDLRTTLRYLGVPIRERSYIFGDNESVVNSSIHPDAKLHKRHNALSFHRVREAIASGKYVFTHISGENNPADILSKHWGYSSVWHMLKALLFVSGETIMSPGKSDKDDTSGGTTEQQVVH
jgi:transposase InsO family protein